MPAARVGEIVEWRGFVGTFTRRVRQGLIAEIESDAGLELRHHGQKLAFTAVSVAVIVLRTVVVPLIPF
jgi:hypothetical protein